MRRRMFAAGIAALAIAVSTMVATISTATADPLSTTTTTTTRAGGPTPNAKLPAAIQVDETKFKVVETLFGAGKQVYDCNSGGTYTFREPMAGLFTLRGLPAGIHGAGPFWADFDGSKVIGTGAVSVPSPAGPSNVAWLRLAAASNAGTGGVLSNVAFIQRTDTRGGAAPAKCGAPTVAVDYTTFYVFWAPR